MEDGSIRMVRFWIKSDTAGFIHHYSLKKAESISAMTSRFSRHARGIN